MLRIGKTVAFLALLGMAVPLFAQSSSRRGTGNSRLLQAHLLNRSLGEAIVETALNTHGWDYYGSDCSHFVNAIFEAAGLPFRYTNSLALYQGTDTFRRVFRPQPGDLIVWRGHVGIVVDPQEHSFYSMLRSGLRLSSYDSPYWRARGHARFLRYAGSGGTKTRTTRMARLRTEEQ